MVAITLNSQPHAGIVYTLQIRRGVLSDRTFLSCTHDGSKVDLWREDDGSKRQNWVFLIRDGGSYHIQILGGVDGGRRKLLSCSPDGERMELTDADDGSGRQRWLLQPTPNGCVNIRVQAGVAAAANRRFLSCTSCGEVVDLWSHDEGSGRQQWLLQPETVRLSLLDFRLEAARVTALPDYTATITISNASYTPQRATFHFRYKAPLASRFEPEDGAVELTAAGGGDGSGDGSAGSTGSTGSTGGKVAVPCRLTSGRVALSSARVWWYGAGAQREDDPRQYSLPLLVPPRSRVSATVIVPVVELDVPYTASGRSAFSGREVACRGVWRGTSLGEVSYAIEQAPL